MDTLTHALSGALLARATERDAAVLPRRTRMWIGFWAAAFPDSDFLLRFIDPLIYLTSHRGWTHSVLLLPLWAVGLALAFSWIYRKKYSIRAFVGVCALGIGAHIVGDVITAFGTMIFSPVSGARVSFPYTFIIDPYFSGIIIAGLVFAAIWRSRAMALTGLAILAGYVGTQAWLHHQAERIGATYATHLDARAEVHALPQPLSPFHWLVVVADERTYHMAYISLWGASAPADTTDSWWRRTYAAYRPAEQAQWQPVARYGQTRAEIALVQEAWRSSTLTGYRSFTMLPALYRVDRSKSGECVWFQDLRFASPGRDMPFRYGACREADSWRMYQLIDDAPHPLTTANS